MAPSIRPDELHIPSQSSLQSNALTIVYIVTSTITLTQKCLSTTEHIHILLKFLNKNTILMVVYLIEISS